MKDAKGHGSNPRGEHSAGIEKIGGGTPLWESLNAVRRATRIEFSPTIAAAHHFVRLPSGEWGRTFGAPPENAKQIGKHVWHIQ